MNNKMIPVDLERLRRDCEKVFERDFKASCDFRALSTFLLTKGFPNNAFYNWRNNYARKERSEINRKITDMEYVTDGIEDKVGLINISDYERLLLLFRFEDVYRIPKRGEAVKEEPKPEIKEQDGIAEQLAAINATLQSIGTVLTDINSKMGFKKPVIIEKGKTLQV